MQHRTDKKYEEELNTLKNLILQMGSTVEEMITKAIRAYDERSDKWAEEIISQDKNVDELEMDIDEFCVRLLALRQPIASDLRFIIIGLKISKDLERMGDLSVNIARRVLEINQEASLGAVINIATFAKDCKKMVKAALDAFVDRNADNARKVCEDDDAVDKLYWSIHAQIVAHMQTHPTAIGQCVRLLSIIRPLERIADYATNIAEDLIYIVQGKDIRHGH